MSDTNDKLVGLFSSLLTPAGQGSATRDAVLTAVQEVVNRLFGKEGAYWLYNLKRFFRKESCFRWKPVLDGGGIVIDVPHTLVGQVMVKGFRVMIICFHTKDHLTPPRFEWSDADQLGYTQLSEDEAAALTSHITTREFYEMGVHWLCHTFFARGEGADEKTVNYRRVLLYSCLAEATSIVVQVNSRSSEEMERVVLTGPGGYAFKMA